MEPYTYFHLDVFTGEKFTGNQLAVLPNAVGLTPDQMQCIATEMAFSETTFVLPAETPNTDVRVRIFTPNVELPMAGHPTVGTAFALAHEGRLDPGQSSYVFGLGIGPTPLGLEWESDRLRFVWMTQPIPEMGEPLSHLHDLTTALGITDADLQAAEMPVRSASAGVTFLLVPVATRKAVDEVVLNRSLLCQYLAKHKMEELPVFVFSPEPGDDGATVYSRMMAPALGVPEDPATGSASGPLGAYLVHHGLVSAEEALRMVSLQGAHMGRPSRIHIAVEAEGKTINQVRIGGEAVLVAEGKLHV